MMLAMVTDTVLTLLTSIIESAKSLIKGTHGHLTTDVLEDVHLIHESSIQLYHRLEWAISTSERSSRQLIHELRGTLSIIVGYAEIILEGIDGDLTEAQRTSIRHLHATALKLALRLHEMYG